MAPYIPLPYRILLLWFEPLAALNGAYLSHFDPAYFLNVMTPQAYNPSFSPLSRPSPSDPKQSIYDPRTQIIYTLLASTYVLFAFNEAVVLRITDDIRVWKALVLGILLCDAGHLWAAWKVLGDGGVAGLRWEDWVNLVMILGPGALRVALCLGVGIKEDGSKRGGKAKVG